MGSTLLFSYYIAHYMPFYEKRYNYMELFNESCTFVTILLIQLFMDDSQQNSSSVRRIKSWMFIGFWFFITFINVVFLIYDSIFMNYNVTFDFIRKQKAIMGEIKSVRGHNLSRGDFIQDYGNDNFLAKFE